MIGKLLVALSALLAVGASDPPAWTKPHAPFRIVGNVYYVGSEGLAAYLITTPKGAILLDGTMEENVLAIEANIRSLGVKLSDVKILLNSHAHFDHAAGLAHLKRDTGATMMAMKGDVWALEHGRHFGDQNYVAPPFAPVKVDRVLTDGATVTLGGVTMTALATPGHTAGCTTWVLPVRIKAGLKTVVFPCSMTVAGNKLVGNRQYPGIVADFRRTFARMATLKADIVLPAHPELAQVLTRKGDEFLQPTLLPNLVADARAAFERQWRKESAIAK
ncbi:MAG: subclass B3 metallo-beta-lactamase [Sphingomonas sp.]|uniref:subclass B3 metallo-beta-lactamase n=1 Tax=Sphingomonas sp. TaxID=28214 RepID=UPI0012164008|nr:subclass B3 metallo-beta-lactamase [Sphingomonas sp.]THD37221.1 MAG: subclass B3 metallo-beta-lactamase [Sphingomonas sp.]